LSDVQPLNVQEINKPSIKRACFSLQYDRPTGER